MKQRNKSKFLVVKGDWLWYLKREVLQYGQ